MFRIQQSWHLLGATFRLWSGTPWLWGYGVFWVALVWAVWWPLSGPVIEWMISTAKQGDETALNMGLLQTLGVYMALNLLRMVFGFSVAGLAMARLEGHRPTGWDAWDAIVRHLGAIFWLSLLHSVVGMVLEQLRERFGWLGELLSNVAAMLWGLATSLTIPALVMRQEASWQEGLSESVSLFKRTWGENLVATVSSGLALGLLTLLVMLAWLVYALLQAPALALPTLMNGAVMILLASWVLGAFFQETFNTVLYRYARLGEVPDAFVEIDLPSQFVPKTA
ncbi:DUF6159 family protein [Ideonella paludis]|uniref:DUF4013 domain-containing protein n=1 Tax=Ideonella paludis TaxID=1233411 RepID=A0ABS5E0V5_9BURK|nr:DUF6159 family protein [Ideonella paludis]MBQ0936696.1 hypothetical protein [Ideonella paludis]